MRRRTWKLVLPLLSMLSIAAAVVAVEVTPASAHDNGAADGYTVAGGGYGTCGYEANGSYYAVDGYSHVTTFGRSGYSTCFGEYCRVYYNSSIYLEDAGSPVHCSAVNGNHQWKGTTTGCNGLFSCPNGEVTLLFY